MSTTNDPISDMLTRVRNALASKKSEVIIPFSRVKLEIARILKDGAWVADFEKTNKKTPDIKIILKYNNEGKSVIKSLKRISTPGSRIYARVDEIPVVLNGLGINILSTSLGIMTSKEAKKKKVGGEILCEIY